MKTFVKAIMGLLIFSLVVTFTWLIEFVYPLGELVYFLLGDFGRLLGKVLSTIALIGDALWVSIIAYSIWQKTFDKFLK